MRRFWTKGVCEIRVAVPTDGLKTRTVHGSGLLVRDDRVLTAAHVLADGRHAVVGDACEVRRHVGEQAWQPGLVIWVDPELDLALVEVELEAERVSFGDLRGSSVTDWECAGFPRASAENATRDLEVAWGKVSPLSGRSGELELVVRSGEPVEQSGWAGMSGSPVFSSEGVLVGVLIDVPVSWTGKLTARRVTSMLEQPAFRAALGDAPHLRLLDNPRPASRQGLLVNTLVDELAEDVLVGREADLALLDRFVNSSPSGRLVLTAPTGFGKSALLANWVRRLQDKSCAVAYHFVRYGEDTSVVARIYENVLRQLSEYIPDLDAPDGTGVDNLLEAFAHLASVPRLDAPVIVVIDGLDEAEQVLRNPFLPQLPDGLHVVVAARAHGDEEPVFLLDWLRNCERFELDRLDEAALASWIRLVDQGQLCALADDAAFLAALAAKTGGTPRYARLVLEDVAGAVAAGEDPHLMLDAISKEFKEYVRQSAGLLDEVDPLVSTAFDILAVARGPIDAKELADVVRYHGAGTLRTRELNVLRSDPRLRRWLRVRERDDGLAELAFADSDEARMFTLVRRPDSDACSASLIAWCGEWRNSVSRRYSSRHLAGHLLELVGERHEGEPEGDLTNRQRLYALADDEAFPYPSEGAEDPEAPLRPVQAALLAAARTDDAAAMVRFMILHARRLSVARASPVEAILSGRGTGSAQAIAEMSGSEDQVIWHLAICWALEGSGRSGAHEAARDILNRPRTQLRGWRSRVAGALLGAIRQLPVDHALSLAEQILDPEDLGVLVRELADRAASDDHPTVDLVAAVRRACALLGESDCAVLLSSVGMALARAGDADAGSQCLADATAALEAAPRIHPEALHHLACGRAHTGEFELARRIADHLSGEPELHVALLLELSNIAATHRANDVALEVLEDARRRAAALDGWTLWRQLAHASDALLRPTQPIADQSEAPSWVRAYAEANGVSVESAVLAVTFPDPLWATESWLDVAQDAAEAEDLGAAERALSGAASAAAATDDPSKVATAAVRAACKGLDGGFDATPQCELARQLVENVAHHDLAADLLALLAHALRTAGRTGEAADAAADALARAELVLAPDQRVYTLLRVARMLDNERAVAALDAALVHVDQIALTATQATVRDRLETERRALVPDAPVDSHTLDGSSDLQSLFGVSAGRIAAARRSNGSTTSASDAIAAEVERFARIAATLGEPMERALLLLAIGSAAATADCAEAAERARAEAVAASEDLPEESRAYINAIVVREQAAAGSFEEMSATVEGIADPEFAAFASWMASCELRQRGEQRAAELLALSICDRLEHVPELVDRPVLLVAAVDALSRPCRPDTVDHLTNAGEQYADPTEQVLARLRLLAAGAGDQLELDAATGAALDISDPVRSVACLLAIAHAGWMRRLDPSAPLEAVRQIHTSDRELEAVFTLAALEVAGLPSVEHWSQTKTPRLVRRSRVLLLVGDQQRATGRLEDADATYALAEQIFSLDEDDPHLIEEERRVREHLLNFRGQAHERNTAIVQSGCGSTEPLPEARNRHSPGVLPRSGERATIDAIESGDLHAGSRLLVEIVGSAVPSHLDREWILASLRDVRSSFEPPIDIRSAAVPRRDPAATARGFRAASGDWNHDGGSPAELAARAMAEISAPGRASTDDSAMRAALLAVPGRRFIEQAHDAAARGDRDLFESFLLPCAYHPEIVGELIPIIGRVYPRQIDSIEAAVDQYVRDVATSA